MTKTLKHFIALILLCPCFIGYVGMNTGQMLYLFIYFVFGIFYFLRIKRNVPVSSKVPIIFLSFLFLSFVYFVSAIYNLKNTSYVIGDIIELFRPIIYFSCYLISSAMFSKENIKNEYALKYIEDVVFYFSFVEWLKFIPLFTPFFKLYTPFDFGSLNYVRMFGTNGFAYGYAWLLAIVAFLNVYRCKKIRFRFFYFSFLVLLTGSRTGFLALAVCYAFVFLYFKKVRGVFLSCLFLLCLLVYILYMLEIPAVVTSIDYTFRLINLLIFHEGADGSYLTRNRQKNIALNYFSTSPIIGVASNKANRGTIENWYFYMLQNWGIVGFVSYLVIIFLLYFYTKKKYKKITKARTRQCRVDNTARASQAIPRVCRARLSCPFPAL